MSEEIYPASIFWRLAMPQSCKAEIVIEVGILEFGMESFDA
jgi:hypothetical protein